MDVREKLSSEKRLIDADAFLEKMKRTSRYFDVVFDVEEMPTVNAVPVSKLEELRDYLYAEDLIFMRGLAELNKLIANCGAKMEGGSD